MAALVPGRLIYLRTPHTASTVVERALVRGIDGAVSVVPGHATLDRFRDRRIRAASGKRVRITGTELVATTIRNPYDVMITAWISTTAKRMPLAEFIRTFDGKHQLAGGSLFTRAEQSDIIMRHETLADDFASMLERLRFPSLTLKRDNVTRNKQPWRTYYDEDSLTAMRDRFGDETEAHGYEVL